MTKEIQNIEDIKTEIMNNVDLKKLTVDELRKAMHVKGETMQASFINALNELEEKGEIYLDDDGYYKKFDAKQLGKVQGEIHINRMGNGFVFIEYKGHKTKYLIDENHLNGALEGDIVVLNNIHHGKTNYANAEVEKIVKRANGKTIFEYAGDGEFIPYTIHGNVTVICPKEELRKLVTGSRVLVNVDKERIAIIENKAVFEGHIEKIVGHKDDPDIEIATIAAEHGFFKEFPDTKFMNSFQFIKQSENIIQQLLVGFISDIQEMHETIKSYFDHPSFFEKEQTKLSIPQRELQLEINKKYYQREKMINRNRVLFKSTDNNPLLTRAFELKGLKLVNDVMKSERRNQGPTVMFHHFKDQKHLEIRADASKDRMNKLHSDHAKSMHKMMRNICYEEAKFEDYVENRQEKLNGILTNKEDTKLRAAKLVDSYLKNK